MGEWTKPEAYTIRGTCVVCAVRPQSCKGEGKFRATCIRCHRQKHGMKTWTPPSYRKHKGETCVTCGFVPEHPCQLDVDHADGNHQNDDPANLVTLCANCHRLKTWKQTWGQEAPFACDGKLRRARCPR